MARTREALVILRHLQQRPANKRELIRIVEDTIPGAYNHESTKARDSCFERDIKTIRQRFESQVAYDQTSNLYSLVDPGPYFRIGLNDNALMGFAFLFSVFDFEGAISDLVRPFLSTVQNLLTSEDIRRLDRIRPFLKLNLEDLDRTEINPNVWRKVGYAVKNRHVLRFNYLSPRHEKPEPRTHTVEPYDPIRFHQGHFELRAYCRHWSNPGGWEKSNAGWIRYRLDRIQPDGLEVLPEILHLSQRQKRLIPICYRVSPDLARGGVSQHFEEMKLGERREDGWVTVTGKTTDLFEAERIFLAYGQHCIVLDPPELAQRMRRASLQMADHYRDLPN